MTGTNQGIPGPGAAAVAASDAPMLDYLESHDPSWSRKAADLLKEKLLHGQARHAPLQVVVTHVWGHCPRCKHRLDVLQTHHPVSGEHAPSLETTTKDDRHIPHRRKMFTLTVACACAPDLHPGAPETGGCGVSFRIEVPFMNQDGS